MHHERIYIRILRALEHVHLSATPVIIINSEYILFSVYFKSHLITEIKTHTDKWLTGYSTIQCLETMIAIIIRNSSGAIISRLHIYV